MTELFSDIPEVMKILVQSTIDSALAQNDPKAAMDAIEAMLKRLPSERLKEFADFYFDLKVEQAKNNE